MEFSRDDALAYLGAVASATLLAAAKASAEPKGQRMRAMRVMLTSNIPRAAVAVAVPYAVSIFAVRKLKESVRNKRTNKDMGNNGRL